MEIRPLILREANAYINANHRHHRGTAGCKFALGLFDNENMVGCAVCGRSVSRYLDDGFTCEINRVCTNGAKNACSMLYDACCRVAKEMGYRKIITYTLQSELGTSLKASGFSNDGIAGGKMWTGRRKRNTGVPPELKYRWVKYLKKQKEGDLNK
ncbi:MAG: GNAT family N-acetyltransferase [Clostridiales bacterium]|nr:GNAT family N-acetyltransferase [Clostridiales bacterium]